MESRLAAGRDPQGAFSGGGGGGRSSAGTDVPLLSAPDGSGDPVGWRMVEAHSLVMPVPLIPGNTASSIRSNSSLKQRQRDGSSR